MRCMGSGWRGSEPFEEKGKGLAMFGFSVSALLAAALTVSAPSDPNGGHIQGMCEGDGKGKPISATIERIALKDGRPVARLVSDSATGLPLGAATVMRNVAHRGLWQEANLPQNTVEAIWAAYAAGAKIVETDFVETKCGEIICLHDKKALASMSSIVKEPVDITPEDRATINLGEKAKLARPYRIPLLKDVLAVVPKDCVLQSEIKSYGKNYARLFDEAVRAAGLTEKNILVSSFSATALADFHAKYPAYETIWLGCGVKKDGAAVTTVIARAKKDGFAAVCPGCEAARAAGWTRAEADRVRAAGLDFRVFGVNSAKSLKYAAELGAASFTCNFFRQAYSWAAELPGVELQPKLGPSAPKLTGCYSDKVRTVGVVMPASVANFKDYVACKAAVIAAGYRVKEAPRLNFSQVASVEDRVADFEEMWMDPEVDLVVCARGGKGAQDLLPKLDWAKLRTRRQRVLGFSNITYLLNAMLKEDAGCPITGPTFTQFRYLAPQSAEWLGKVLGGEKLPPVKLKALRGGACSGLPCGGHISMLKGAFEMKQLPDAKGRIVFLECSAREPSVHEAELDFLAKSGWLDGAAGIVFGDITPGGPNRRKLKGAALKAGYAREAEIKRAFAAKVKCPVYDGYPYGHVPKNFAVDFQRAVAISADGMLTFK